MSSFTWRLTKERKKLLDQIKEKIGYEADSKNLERALQLFLRYHQFIKSRFYDKFEEIQKEVPLK